MADLDRLVDELVGQAGVRDVVCVDRREQAHDEDEEEHAAEEQRHLVATQPAPSQSPGADPRAGYLRRARPLSAGISPENSVPEVEVVAMRSQLHSGGAGTA